MKKIVKKLKKIPWLMKVHWLIFSWQGKVWFFYSLKVMMLSSLDLLKMPEQKWTKKAIWKQISFQRFFRSPKVLTHAFGQTLRICITYRCNLTCQYCYARGLEKDMPIDMSVDTFLKLVLWAKEKGWKDIRFLGGEPTIHPYFTEMLNICYKNKMNVGMSTNNIFSSQIASKFDTTRIRYISINYTFDA
jgi:sulfatase maturation enzyme AslB (radical SAM superfamily)